jgi:hypothetical protein
MLVKHLFKDLEVSDLSTEDVKVDGIPRHVYYTGKDIWRLSLSEAMSSVPYWVPLTFQPLSLKWV